MKKFFVLSCFPILVLTIVACASHLKSEVGSVAIKVSNEGAARSLYPDLDTEVKSYDLFGTGPDSATFSKTGLVKGSHSVGGLAAGEWTITVIGKNADDVEIIEGSATAEVKPAETTTVELTCLPSVGEGTLELALSWPKSLIGAAKVVASLTPEDGEEEALSFDIEPSQTEERSLTSTAKMIDTKRLSGSYLLTMELQSTKGGETKSVWGLLETVLIMKGAKTSGSWVIEPGEPTSGGIALSLGENAPIAVTLSGSDKDILQGSPLQIEASADQDPVTWRWYLNATSVKGATAHSANLVLDTATLNGGYCVNVLARKGKDLGSGSFAFQVYPNNSDHTRFSGPFAGYACNGASAMEKSKGVFTLSSGPCDTTLNKSELVGKNRKDPLPGKGEYLGGKAFLGLPIASGKKLTSNFRVSFTRTIDSYPSGMTDPSVCMYFNLIVAGDAVHNTKEGTGVLVAATPAAGTSVVLDGKSVINNISGGWIGVDEQHKIEKNKITIADLANMGVTFVNAETKDNGTPIGKKLAAVLIIVGDSRGKDSPNGSMANVVMTVSDLKYSF